MHVVCACDLRPCLTTVRLCWRRSARRACEAHRSAAGRDIHVGAVQTPADTLLVWRPPSDFPKTLKTPNPALLVLLFTKLLQLICKVPVPCLGLTLPALATPCPCMGTSNLVNRAQPVQLAARAAPGPAWRGGAFPGRRPQAAHPRAVRPLLRGAGVLAAGARGRRTARAAAPARPLAASSAAGFPQAACSCVLPLLAFSMRLAIP